MIPLSSTISSGLTWAKLPSNRGYELKRNGEMVGSLRRPSSWCSRFVAETQNGQWTFRRGGWLGAGAQILNSTSQPPIASFKSVWGCGGTLTFADGQTFRLECKGLWRPVWSVIGEAGQPVVRLHTREKAVELPTGVNLPEDRLLLLIMFVWYQVLQAREDAASVAVIAAS